MKKVTEKIFCDRCDADISPHLTGFPAHYIIKVTCEDIARSEGGATFAMMIHKPIKNDLYFCNLACMKRYEHK